MSASTCWAESLKPIGMPPLRSRTLSANARKSSTDRRSSKAAGETASWPGSIPRTSAMRSVTLRPGRWPPVPVFAAWPALKWNARTSSSSPQSHPKRPVAYSRR